jgi:hypothetical protein
LEEAITVGELCEHLLFASFELHEFIIFKNDYSGSIRLILNYVIWKACCPRSTSKLKNIDQRGCEEDLQDLPEAGFEHIYTRRSRRKE